MRISKQTTFVLPRSRWFWLAWSFTWTFAGLVVSVPALLRPIDLVVAEFPVYTLTVLIGIPAGLGQAWLLRSVLPEPDEWAMVTIIACAGAVIAAVIVGIPLAYALALLLTPPSGDRTVWVLSRRGLLIVTVVGAVCGWVVGWILGRAQEPLLRRAPVGPKRWVRRSRQAGTLAVALLLALSTSLSAFDTRLAIVVSMLAATALYGAITGRTLSRLLADTGEGPHQVAGPD